MDVNTSAQDLDPVRLCEDCRYILIGPRDTGRPYRHKTGNGALLESADKGCGFCKILNAAATKVVENHEVETANEGAGEYCEIFYEQAKSSMDEMSADPIDGFEYLIRFWKEDQGNHGLIRFKVHLSLVSGVNPYIGGRLVAAQPDLTLARTWITQCHLEHVDCRHENERVEQQLPTRIIDVGPSDGSQVPRLVLGNGLQGRYICLSHCWGDGALPMTTTSNLDQRLLAIHPDTLPPTFRDAITTTRLLDHRYLWIDSLCILQDDKSDWSQECPKMSSVYKGSSVTIGAASSPDSSGGLLHKRSDDLPVHMIRVCSPDDNIDTVIAVRTFSDRLPSMRSLKDSTLGDRAWTFQETILPPRVLYFGVRQMYFECNMSRACESFVHTDFKLMIEDSPALKYIGNIERTQLHTLWESVIGQFSLRSLTYGDDQLPALAGLAAYVGEKLQDDYCAGLWKSDLINGLQWQIDWRAENWIQPVHAAKFQAPSWSWVSPGHPITFAHDFHPEQLDFGRCMSTRSWCSATHINILDIQTQGVDSNPFGQVSSGHITLSGKIKSVTVEECSGCQAVLLDAGSFIADAVLDSRIFPAHLRASLGDETPEVLCLLMSSGQWQEPDYGWMAIWSGIVLEKVPGSENTFRRIGFVQRYDFTSFADELQAMTTDVADVTRWWDDAEPRTIVLV